jgi:hypothetical protein
MLDLEGRATVAMVRWGPGVHQRSIWNYRPKDGAPVSNSQTVDRNSSHQNQAREMLWPTAVAVFLFTASYPSNDFATASTASDIGLGMFLVYAGIAVVTAGVVFALVLPWGFVGKVPVDWPWHSRSRARCRHQASGPGSLPDSRPAVRCSAGPESTRRKAAGSRKPPFVTGVLGVLFNVVSYADVFI